MTRFFALKAWLGGAGFALGLVGMASDRRWLVWCAVGLLVGAFLLRLAERDRATPP